MEVHDKQQEFLSAYEQFADAIFRHGYFRTSDRERARDVTQETFTRTWEYLAKGGEIKSMKAFLYRIANNLIVDDFRKKKSHSLDELQEEGLDPVDTSVGSREAALDAKAAVAVLDQLDPSYRDVITLRYVDDLSPREIAEVLHQTENAVSVRLHRGLRKAREILEKNNEPYSSQRTS
ncbi:MAG: hypothetical protein A2542_03015 [Parcubacteria group bacterium RIFOXYD2_FULL_52_8]|nr:MAG: hypothetical protein A2542_03015 [Parcubacteria group bacterium RIFOXYD2_FULL_52_8]